MYALFYYSMYDLLFVKPNQNNSDNKIERDTNDNNNFRQPPRMVYIPRESKEIPTNITYVTINNLKHLINMLQIGLNQYLKYNINNSNIKTADIVTTLTLTLHVSLVLFCVCVCVCVCFCVFCVLLAHGIILEPQKKI